MRASICWLVGRLEFGDAFAQRFHLKIKCSERCAVTSHSHFERACPLVEFSEKRSLDPLDGYFERSDVVFNSVGPWKL